MAKNQATDGKTKSGASNFTSCISHCYRIQKDNNKRLCVSESISEFWIYEYRALSQWMREGGVLRAAVMADPGTHVSSQP